MADVEDIKTNTKKEGLPLNNDLILVKIRELIVEINAIKAKLGI